MLGYRYDVLGPKPELSARTTVRSGAKEDIRVRTFYLWERITYLSVFFFSVLRMLLLGEKMEISPRPPSSVHGHNFYLVEC